MHSVRDGGKGLGTELGTALLRKLKSSRNGGGRERRVIIGVLCNGRRGRREDEGAEGAGWGRRWDGLSLEGWQRPDGATHHLLPRGLSGQSSKWLSPHPS